MRRAVRPIGHLGRRGVGGWRSRGRPGVVAGRRHRRGGVDVSNENGRDSTELLRGRSRGRRSIGKAGTPRREAQKAAKINRTPGRWPGDAGNASFQGSAASLWPGAAGERGPLPQTRSRDRSRRSRPHQTRSHQPKPKTGGVFREDAADWPPSRGTRRLIRVAPCTRRTGRGPRRTPGRQTQGRERPRRGTGNWRRGEGVSQGEGAGESITTPAWYSERNTDRKDLAWRINPGPRWCMTRRRSRC